MLPSRQQPEHHLDQVAAPEATVSVSIAPAAVAPWSPKLAPAVNAAAPPAAATATAPAFDSA